MYMNIINIHIKQIGLKIAGPSNVQVWMQSS